MGVRSQLHPNSPRIIFLLGPVHSSLEFNEEEEKKKPRTSPKTQRSGREGLSDSQAIAGSGRKGSSKTSVGSTSEKVDHHESREVRKDSERRKEVSGKEKRKEERGERRERKRESGLPQKKVSSSRRNI